MCALVSVHVCVNERERRDSEKALNLYSCMSSILILFVLIWAAFSTLPQNTGWSVYSLNRIHLAPNKCRPIPRLNNFSENLASYWSTHTPDLHIAFFPTFTLKSVLHIVCIRCVGSRLFSIHNFPIERFNSMKGFIYFFFIGKHVYVSQGPIVLCSGALHNNDVEQVNLYLYKALFIKTLSDLIRVSFEQKERKLRKSFFRKSEDENLFQSEKIQTSSAPLDFPMSRECLLSSHSTAKNTMTTMILYAELFPWFYSIELSRRFAFFSAKSHEYVFTFLWWNHINHI